MFVTSTNNAGPANNNNDSGGVSEPNNRGCYPRAVSALLTLVGSALVIAGLSLYQRRYSHYVGSTVSVFPINYDLFFYQQKTSIRFGASETGPLKDCLKAPYTAAMTMSVIGAAIALLVGIPLTYCIHLQYKSKPLRFVRPLVVLFGGTCVLIGAIISAATTTCEGNDFSEQYKLSTGFHLLIAGACIILAASFLGLLQAAACPDSTAPASPHQQINTEMALASSNAAPHQHQHQHRTDPYASGGGNMYATTGNSDIYGGGKSVY